MPVISHCPAAHVFPALQFIRDAAAVIESGQGGSKEVKIIVASLETIRAAVEWNAGVRAAAIDTFESARALAAVAAPPDRFRLRRLLRQAVVQLGDRLGAPGDWATRAEAA